MPEFHVVAQIDELQPGEMKHVEIGDEEIAVFNLGGQYYALSDVCSHQYALLTEGEVYAVDGTVECPLHGSEFDIRSGRALSLPATEPVPVFEVRINGTDVEVALP